MVYTRKIMRRADRFKLEKPNRMTKKKWPDKAQPVPSDVSHTNYKYFRLQMCPTQITSIFGPGRVGAARSKKSELLFEPSGSRPPARVASCPITIAGLLFSVCALLFLAKIRRHRIRLLRCTE